MRIETDPSTSEWQECGADDVICDPVADITGDGSEAAQTDLVILYPVAAVNADMTPLGEDTRLSGYLTEHCMPPRPLTDPLEETTASVGLRITAHELLHNSWRRN